MREEVFFSVFMCVYNKDELLEHAIASVLEQSGTSLELLILDNSDSNREKTWSILSEISEKDFRVKIFRSSENVGWAKGASLLLKQASGRYMTFLAADDFLLPRALEKVKKATEETKVDVLWAGNKFYEFREERFWEIGEAVPSPKIVMENRKAENIKYVMEHVFYNSFFHYVKVEFLKQEKIDFYNHGYGDSAGMVRVLSRAGRMAVLDEAVYGLTANTSQSRGTFYWDGELYLFSDQWESVKEAYMRDLRFSFQELKYCAMAILENEIGNLRNMAEGSKCVDKQMNAVPKKFQDRLQKIKQILENSSIQEMVQFYGRFDYEKEILIVIEKLLDVFQDEYKMEELAQMGWLGKFLQARYSWAKNGVEVKGRFETEEIQSYAEALGDSDNISIFGIGAFLESANMLEKHVLLENQNFLENIFQAYGAWKNRFVERLWTEFGKGGALTGRSRAELAAFCKYILEN